jgi:hypothetical protein
MEDLASRNLLVSIYTDSIDGDNFNCDPLFEYSTNIDSTDYKYTFGTYPRSSTSVTDSNNFFLPIPILSSIATSPNIKPIDFLKSGCSSGSYDVICDAIDSYDAINGGVDTSDRIKQCITQFVSYFFTSFNEKGTN